MASAVNDATTASRLINSPCVASMAVGASAGIRADRNVRTTTCLRLRRGRREETQQCRVDGLQAADVAGRVPTLACQPRTPATSSGFDCDCSFLVAAQGKTAVSQTHCSFVLGAQRTCGGRHAEGQRGRPGVQPRALSRRPARLVGPAVHARGRVRSGVRRRRFDRRHPAPAGRSRRELGERAGHPHPELGVARSPSQRRHRGGRRRVRAVRRSRRRARGRGLAADVRLRGRPPVRRRDRQGRSPAQGLGCRAAVRHRPAERDACRTTRPCCCS